MEWTYAKGSASTDTTHRRILDMCSGCCTPPLKLLLNYTPELDKISKFIFQKDFAPAHTVKFTKSCFNEHIVTVFDQTNSPKWNPSFCQEEHEKHQYR